MYNSIGKKIIFAALIISAGTAGASAMSIMQPHAAQQIAENPAFVQVHSLHNNCQFNSVTPSGTGNPKSWHRTAEAGVHTNCTPTRKPGAGELTIKPSGGNSQNLQLRN